MYIYTDKRIKSGYESDKNSSGHKQVRLCSTFASEMKEHVGDIIVFHPI